MQLSLLCRSSLLGGRAESRNHFRYLMHIHHMRGLSWMKEVMSLGTDDKIPICSFIPWDKETSEHLNNNS